MVSRQTFVVTGFVLATLPAAYLVELATKRFAPSFSALLGVGVGASSLVNDYFDSRERGEDGVWVRIPKKSVPWLVPTR